jgi:hypothetical protein
MLVEIFHTYGLKRARADVQMPSSATRASVAASKCNPAVGAAIAPGSRA